MTTGRSCEVGGEVEVPMKPLVLVGQLILNSTRLPRARQLELGVGEFERAWFLGTLPLLNGAGASDDRIDSVLIRLVGDGVERAVLDPYGNHVYRSEWTVGQTARGGLVSQTSFPLTVALKLSKLVEETIEFHGWPELGFTTGAGPEAVSAACEAVFGTPARR